MKLLGSVTIKDHTEQFCYDQGETRGPNKFPCQGIPKALRLLLKIWCPVCSPIPLYLMIRSESGWQLIFNYKEVSMSGSRYPLQRSVRVFKIIT